MPVGLIGGPLLALLLLGTGAAAAGPARPCASAGGAAVAVTAVVAGDTLALADGRIVHVAGVEAATEDRAGAPLAAAARDAVARLVAGGPVVFAPMPPAPDRYGRLHGEVGLAGGGSLGEALVRAGLARVRLFPGERPCVGTLLAAEAGARAERRGLWALDSYAVRRADDSSLLARSGLYDLVEGRIVSVGHGKRMVFLDFGRNFSRDFTVMIPTAMVDQLAVSADALKERRIRVRGVIELSGGPAIRLGSPEEIELLDGE